MKILFEDLENIAHCSHSQGRISLDIPFMKK